MQVLLDEEEDFFRGCDSKFIISRGKIIRDDGIISISVIWSSQLISISVIWTPQQLVVCMRKLIFNF